MASAKDKTSWLIGSGFGVILLIVLGVLLGYFLFSNDLFAKPAHHLMTAIALGLVWALLLLQWVDLLNQSLSLSTDPVPETVDLNDREGVRAHAEGLTGKRLLVARARRLLESWANGSSPRQILDLAAFQSEQAKNPLRAATVFSLILLAGSIWQGGNSVLAWASLVVVAVTLYARQNMLNQIDFYLESHLLSRLPAGGNSATATGSQLGSALGDAIERSFKAHMPQPEQLSAAISSAVGEVSKETGNVLKQVQEALSQHAQEIGSAGSTWSEQIGGVLAQHADTLQAANGQLATQLEKIARIEEDIEKVLHIQETVDKTLQSVTATEEFQQTLQALRSHVEESSKLLRELAKPRKIRLVETPAQVAQSKADY